MSGKRSIPVRILGHEYRIRSEADETVVRRAASLVDQTMQRIRSRTGTVDSLDLAVLAALNLANRVVAGGVVAGEGPSAVVEAPLDGSRVQALLERVEAALEQPATASS